MFTPIKISIDKGSPDGDKTCEVYYEGNTIVDIKTY